MDWPCPQCTYDNPAVALVCEMCGEKRGVVVLVKAPLASPSISSQAATLSPSTSTTTTTTTATTSFLLGRGLPWRCRASGCSAMNSAVSILCEECHRGREDDGKRGRDGVDLIMRAGISASTSGSSVTNAVARTPTTTTTTTTTIIAPSPPAAVQLPTLSAFDTSRPFFIDASGQPTLEVSEVLWLLTPGVDVYDGEFKARSAVGGELIITSRRFLWTDSSRSTRHSWPLAAVKSASGEEGGLFTSRSQKVSITLFGCGGGGRPAHVRLGFKEGGRDAWLKALVEALDKRTTTLPLTTPTPTTLTPTPMLVDSPAAAAAFTTKTTSVGGGLAVGAREAVRQRDAAEAAASRALAATAFSGLAALAAHAQDILKLAEQTAAELRAVRERRGDVAGAKEEAAVAEMLADLGAVGNPVTRTTAGRAYVDALARQIAEFARPRLATAGGLLPLTDVYCAYNRARGVDLVSPEDVLAALARAPHLRLGMAVREVSLGGGGGGGGAAAQGKTPPTRFLALDEMDDHKVAARVAQLIISKASSSSPSSSSPPSSKKSYPSVSQLELAAAWRVPLAVAAAHLRVAEAAGAVVRDESVAGTRFFSNNFT
jgi:ESCRT-II complex subunit VPS36